MSSKKKQAAHIVAHGLDAPVSSPGLSRTTVTPLEAALNRSGESRSVRPEFTERQMQDALTKYKEFYIYSADVLLKEHERFNRADDKASKYSTILVFLMGVAAYFEKWSFDHIVKQPDGYIDLPTEWPIMVVGAITLGLSGVGWYL